MTPYRYRIHGLTLTSAMELPELAPAPAGDESDVLVEQGDVESRLAKVRDEGPCWMAGEGQFLLDIAEVARYRVSGGNHVRIQAAPGATPGDIRVFLLGSALGVLLHQRGLLALHAGAVEVDGQAVAFAGHSGAGKSTLVAHLRQRGHRLISDDLLTVSLDAQGQPWTQPSFARIKLWADALRHIPHREDMLARCHSRLDKFLLSAPDDYRDQPIPLKRLYILAENHEDDTVSLQPMTGLDAVKTLARETYKPRQIKAMGLEMDHFKLCSRTAGRIEMAVLRRPKKLTQMARVLDFLEATWKSHD